MNCFQSLARDHQMLERCTKQYKKRYIFSYIPVYIQHIYHGFADCWEQGKLVIEFCGYLSNKHKRETNASGGAHAWGRTGCMMGWSLETCA